MSDEIVEDSTEEIIDDSQEMETEEIEEGSDESEDSMEDSDEAAVEADTEEELEQELQEAAEAGASKEELTNMVRQFTLKVNNKEYIKEIDLNDEDAVRNELQKAMAGQQAMQQKAELQKMFDSEKRRLMDDPFSVLTELGLDPTDLSAKHLEKYLQEKSKSPEQLEQEKVRKEFEMMKSEVERLKKEKEENERNSKVSAAEKEIESDIIGALELDSDLVASPEVINMVVDNMLWAMQNGFPDVAAKDVIPTVKKELESKYRSYAKSMKSTTALKSLLGDDILNNLKEERIQKVTKKVNNLSNVKTTGRKVEKKEEPKKKLSLSDFMNGR